MIMADLIKLNIDGRDIEVEPGTLILEAARRLGIEIPTFCYDERLKSVGACRMCLVEVEKSPKLVASCATPIAPGMVVRTESDRVIEARKAVLEFLLINHPLDCPTCDKGGECPLQNLTYKYGPPISRYRERKVRFQEGTNLGFDDLKIGPEIWLNRNRCIICYKCVRIARDLGGSTDIGMFKRGAFAQIDIPQSVQYANEFSGNTVEYCPVGALMSDSFRYKVRTWLMQRTPSICWLCPDGCNITVEQRLSHIYRHSSRRNDNIDSGFLCDKGRFAFDLTSGKERIRIPQTVVSGQFKDISYDEALALAVHHLGEEKGESAALLIDTAVTNEEAYCAAEFFRENYPGSHIAISSAHNYDTDDCESNLGLAAPLTDIEKADLIILAGCDLEAEHPIVGLRIKKLINKGIPVYSIGSRRMTLGRFPLINVLTNVGEEHLAFDEIVGNSQRFVLGSDLLGNIQSHLKSLKNIHILSGIDYLDNPNRKSLCESIKSFVAKYSAQWSILPEESNCIGVRQAARPNISLEKLIEKAEQGEIRTMLMAGGNPINIYPDRKRIMAALKKIDYIIYWGAYPNSSSDLASLIFPQALPPEKAGSFVNIERRIQFIKEAYPTDRAITSLIKLLTEIKSELGGKLYYSAREVFTKMAEGFGSFKGLTYGIDDGAILLCDRLQNNPPRLDNYPIQPPADYQFVLTFAKSVYYGASGMTIRSQVLSKLVPPQTLHISPADASRLGLAANDKVKMNTQSEPGDFILVIDDKLTPGQLLISGFSVDNPPNIFMVGHNRPVYANITKIN